MIKGGKISFWLFLRRDITLKLKHRMGERLSLAEGEKFYRINGELTTIETKIDRLVDFVNIRGIVGIKETARALNIEADKVEKFAEILEKHGLIEIKYGIRGLFLAKAGNGGNGKA